MLWFFAFFLFTGKKSWVLPAKLLALIYLFQGMEMLNAAFYRYFDYWAFQFPWVFYLTEFTFFLWGPAIYFFFLISIKPSTELRKKDALHILPALIHSTFLILRFQIHTNAEKTEMLLNGVMSATEDFTIHLLRNLSVIIYLLLAIYTIRTQKDKSNEYYNRSWISFFIAVFITVELIQILHSFDIFNRHFNTLIYNTTAVIWFFVVITTLFKAMQNPLFFLFTVPNNKDEEAIKDIFGEIELPEEKATSSVNKQKQLDDEIIHLKEQIKKAIEEDDAYLDPELNLPMFAKILGLTTNKVSHIVNEHFQQSFTDFVNSYRVAKAKELLVSKEGRKKTILAIAFEVGFNSKATFNRAFARFSDMSPSQYRNSQP